MSVAIPSPSNCCDPCSDQVTTQIPGVQGKSAYQIAVDEGFAGTIAEWLASLDGADGQNSSTDLAAAFTVPDAATPASATVDNSDWAVIGQVVFLEGAGYFSVASVPDATHVVLDNLDYAGNAADGTVIAIGSHLGPGGIKGADGTSASGDMLYADNLNAMGNNDTSLSNLGASTVGRNILKLTSPSALTFLRMNADNTVTARAASDFRTDLALGTIATQAASAVAITGGTLNGTLGATTPASAAVTTLAASGAANLSGATALIGVTTASSKLFLTSSAVQSLLAATSISPNAVKVRVAGNGGAVTLIATPTITAPAADGQLLIIQGNDAVNTVTLQDEGGLAGTQLELGAATRLLGLGDTIGLLWDSATSKWYELFFTNN